MNYLQKFQITFLNLGEVAFIVGGWQKRVELFSPEGECQHQESYFLFFNNLLKRCLLLFYVLAKVKREKFANLRQTIDYLRI